MCNYLLYLYAMQHEHDHFPGGQPLPRLSGSSQGYHREGLSANILVLLFKVVCMCGLPVMLLGSD
jgi:hypothetical protein